MSITNLEHEVEHEITIAAPAPTVYRFIAEVEKWPQIFPPAVYVEQVEQGEADERIRIWATAGEEVKSWSSRRVLDPANLRIDFEQEVSSPPVASMGGTWLFEPLPDETTRLRLLHHYRAVDDAPEGLRWIADAVDHNSRVELASLRDTVRQAWDARGLTFSFADSVLVRGAAADVYDFINDAGRWAERLPHVVGVDLEEGSSGLQTLRMDTRAEDGSVHTTMSYRVCLPHRRIAYKQVTLPALMTLHTGRWTFEQTPAGVLASSQHTVVLNPENITRVLGPGAGVAQARAFVHSALSTNSLATLGHAKEYAEGRR